MKMNMKRVNVWALVCAMAIVIAPAAQAATLYWDGGSTNQTANGNNVSEGGAGTWNTTLLNWDAGAVPHVAWNNANNDTALFAGTAGIVTLGEGITVGGLIFNTASYTVTNNTLTFGAAGSINNAGAATIASALAGNVLITKGGAGTLTLSNTGNTFTGAISISGGGVSAASLGDSAGAGSITLSSVTFTYGATATSAMTLNNRQILLSGSPTINNSSSYALTINTDIGFSGAGARTLNLGTATGTSTFGGRLTDNPSTGALSLSIGTWRLSGTNTYSGETAIANYLTAIFQGLQALSTNTPTITIPHGSGITLLSDDTGTINYPNTTIYVNGNNDITGHSIFVGNNTPANGGNNPGSPGANGTIAFNNLTFFQKSDNPSITVAVTGANGFRLQFNNVTLPVTGYSVFGNITFNPTTAPLTLAGTIIQSSGNPSSVGPKTLVLGGTATNNLVSGNIKDAADYPSNPNAKALSVTKSGTSIWTLSGTNTYSGSTTVSAGTLIANGTNALGAGNVTVSAGTLSIQVANAMADTAELRLPSASTKNITMNANDTVGALYLAGAQQPNGVYSSSGAGSAWMNTGSGTLTVGSAVMYWDISGTTAGAGGATPAGTWNASNATWNDPAGTGTAASWTAGLTAAFAAGSDATGTYTVTVDSTQDIGGLTFEEGDVTLTGGTALQMTANNSVYVAANRTATIATPFTQDVSGRALTKGGTGTLVLSADNTYSGVTTLSAGTLRLSHANAIGSAQVLNVTGSATVLLDTTVNLTTLWFASGVSTVSGGTLNFAPGGSIRAMDNTVNQTITSGITGSPTVRVNNGPAGDGYEGLIFAPNSGTQTLGVMYVPDALGGSKDKGGVHLAGTTTGNSVSAVTFTAVNDSHYGTLYKDGSGTWTVGNVDIGTIRINGGTLVANGYLRYYYAGVFVNSGGALHYNNPGAAYNGFTLNGGSFLDNSSGAAITNSTYNPAQNWSGDWTFLGSNGTNSDLYIGTGAVTLSATRQVTVSNAVTTLTVGGVITGAGGLVKAGAGTLKLTGKNTYSGATTVSNGTLQVVVGGSCSNSAVTVATSAGTLAISVTNTVPKWTCSNLTLDSGNLKFIFSVAPSFTDAPLSITNTVAFTGSPTLVVDPANLQRAKKYPLLTVGGTPPVNVPAVSITGMSGILAWEGNTLYLTIPPPGTIIMLR
jgi:fibronectin-binding autotransporter adhesin